MTVQAGKNHDFLLGYQVEDAVGESTEQGPAHFPVDNGERKRTALDGFKTLIKRLDKPVAEIVSPLPVPLEDHFDVRLRCGREAQDHFLRTREPRTCDQRRAARGSFW